MLSIAVRQPYLHGFRNPSERVFNRFSFVDSAVRGWLRELKQGIWNVFCFSAC